MDDLMGGYVWLCQNENAYFTACPHCGITIMIPVNDVNCRIFRCGEYKASGEPLPPHLKKAECDRLAADNLIWGCAKPFRLTEQNTVEICDYI